MHAYEDVVWKYYSWNLFPWIQSYKCRTNLKKKVTQVHATSKRYPAFHTTQPVGIVIYVCMGTTVYYHTIALKSIRKAEYSKYTPELLVDMQTRILVLSIKYFLHKPISLHLQFVIACGLHDFQTSPLSIMLTATQLKHEARESTHIHTQTHTHTTHRIRLSKLCSLLYPFIQTTCELQL